MTPVNVFSTGRVMLRLIAVLHNTQYPESEMRIYYYNDPDYDSNFFIMTW